MPRAKLACVGDDQRRCVSVAHADFAGGSERTMMKMMTVAATLASAACAGAIHRVAQVTEGFAIASLACDAGSTHAAMHPSTRFRYAETNPVLGPFPSDGAQAAYFSGAGAAVAGINYVLTRGSSRVAGDVWRIVANVAVIGVEISAIQSNTDVHVPLCGVNDSTPTSYVVARRAL